VFAFTPSTAATSLAGGKPLPGLGSAARNCAANLARNLLIEGDAFDFPMQLDLQHDAKYSSTIILEADMTIVDSEPTAQKEEPIALIEEARRHRRHRRRFSACVVALVVTVSLGAAAGFSWTSGGGPSSSAPTATAPSLVGLIANNNAYRECSGSARIGPATSPDGLPARASRTSDLPFVVSVAQNMTRGPYLGFTHRIRQLPVRSAVKDIRVGPGGGYVWAREASGQIEVEHVKNYGIYVYLTSASLCPTGGWARWADGGVQVTFLAPNS
jgi:hypothetical protein